MSNVSVEIKSTIISWKEICCLDENLKNGILLNTTKKQTGWPYNKPENKAQHTTSTVSLLQATLVAHKGIWTNKIPAPGRADPQYCQSGDLKTGSQQHVLDS